MSIHEQGLLLSRYAFLICSPFIQFVLRSVVRRREVGVKGSSRPLCLCDFLVQGHWIYAYVHSALLGVLTIWTWKQKSLPIAILGFGMYHACCMYNLFIQTSRILFLIMGYIDHYFAFTSVFQAVQASPPPQCIGGRGRRAWAPKRRYLCLGNLPGRAVRSALSTKS